MLVLVLLVAYYFRAQLLAVLQSVSPSLAAAVAPVLSVGNPATQGPVIAPGVDTAFQSAFHSGTDATFSGNLFAGPIGRQLGSIGVNPGFGVGSGSIGAPVGPVPNNFGKCSTQPGDGKALCE